MKPANETPTVKSKYTKVIESFEKLSLSDKQEAYPLLTELLERDLEREKESLQSKITSLSEYQATIKKA